MSPFAHLVGLFRHPIWFWKGRWRLDGWQNQTIFIAMFAASLWIAIKRGHSFVEVISECADQALIRVLRKWFRTDRDGV